MKIRYFLFALLVSGLLFSCTRELALDNEPSETETDGGIVRDSIFRAEVVSDGAESGDSTKVYINKSDDGLFWNGSAYDFVRVYLDSEGKNYNVYHTMSAKSASTTLGFESGDLAKEAGYFRAFYPDAAPELGYKDEVFSVNLPPEQQFVQESGTNPRKSLYMVAACGTDRVLRFHHVTHLVRVNVSCSTSIKITRVRMAAAGGEAISGKLAVAMKDGDVTSVSVASDGSSYVENNMGGIACSSSTTRTLYLMIAPGTYKEGFVLSVDYRYNERNYTYSVSAADFTAARGYKTTISLTVPMLSEGRGRLADVDYIDLSSQGTANCYVVNNAAVGRTGSYYKFKADVRGNGVAPGYPSTIVVNKTTGRTATMYYSAGDSFIDTSIGSKGFSYDNGYIYFKTNSQTAAGSALVNLKDKDGKTLWSWHIWSAPALANVDVSGVGTFLNMNLGARQVEFSSTGGNGFYYQWGRKDPMPQEYNTSNYGSMKSGTYFPPFISAQSQSLSGTIQNPHKFRSGGYVYNDLNSSYGTDLWNKAKSMTAVEKTMFDPCPPGYSLPSRSQWMNSALKGKLTLPMASYRTVGGDNTQKIYADKWNSAGYYWVGYAFSSTGSILKAARGWATSSGSSIGISDDTNGTDGMYGCNVRCVKNGEDKLRAYAFETTSFKVTEGDKRQLVLLVDGKKYDLVKNPEGVRIVGDNLETLAVNQLGFITARTQGVASVSALAADGTVLATASVTVTGASASFNYRRPIAAGMIYSNNDVCYGPTAGKTAAQSFRIAKDGTYYIGGICNNTTYPHVYLQKMTPNAGTHTDYMTLQYAGHCNNFEVEISGSDHYIWMCNLAGLNDSDQYMNEQVVTRVKYEAGKEYLPEDCPDIYWFGKFSGSLQMAIDFENDIFLIGYSGPAAFKVFRLSDVLAVTSTKKVTMKSLTRGGLGSSPIETQETVTPELKVHDCSGLKALASIEIQPWRLGGDSDHAYQGLAVYENRIYLIYGNGGSGPYDAIVTAIDFEGNIVSGPNHLALDDDPEAYLALGLGGGSIRGYFEPESVQIRKEGGVPKMYVGFIWQDATASKVWKHCTINIDPE